MRAANQRSAGFTLVELLVVMAVIASLAGLLLPALARAKEKAKVIKVHAELYGVGLALEMYSADHGGQLPPPGVYQRILREVELPLIEIALDATAGNQAKCADLLGINRNTLRKKITDLDIRVSRRRKLM